jgi:hypothetical protein
MGCKRRARVSRDGDGGGGGGGEEEPAPAAAESKSLYEVAPGGADGGASPDSLRNTPSNIARLEDAIEHCAARRKYLARTKSPSDGEDVRWYSCKGHPPPPPAFCIRSPCVGPRALLLQNATSSTTSLTDRFSHLW